MRENRLKSTSQVSKIVVMKKLLNSLAGRRYICFLDFEGTQFSHEMIAYGAVMTTINNKGEIKTVKKPIKYYVRAKNKIGKVVEDMTGITDKILLEKGVSFSDAIRALKKYCGLHFQKTTFITFGNHDMRILGNTVSYNLGAPTEITKVIHKNHVDLQAIISEFIKDPNNNPYSLENYLKVFSIPFEGIEHDPEWDAVNLMKLYEAFLKNKDIVLDEYLKVLTKVSHLPLPIKESIKKLATGEDVTSQEFIALAEEYIK